MVRLVGDQQGWGRGCLLLMDSAARGNSLVGDRYPVAVRWWRTIGIWTVGIDIDPIAGRVERPLLTDMRSRSDDCDLCNSPFTQHAVGDVQAESGFARRGCCRR